MIDFRKVKAETTAITRQKDQFYVGTGNIYETVAILSKRANQIATEEKQELNKKIREQGADRSGQVLREAAKADPYRHRGVPQRRALLSQS